MDSTGENRQNGTSFKKRQNGTIDKNRQNSTSLKKDKMVPLIKIDKTVQRQKKTNWYKTSFFRFYAHNCLNKGFRYSIFSIFRYS